MKKLIFFIVLMSSLSIYSNNSIAGIIRGAVQLQPTAPGAGLTIKFVGVYGVCTEGDIQVGGTVVITGIGGEWEIIELTPHTKGDGDEEIDINLSQLY
jgi:hypothetical protein